MLVDRSQVCALIPAYHEGAHIGDVVRRVRKQLDHALVVDDGSPDATAELAREAGAEVIRHEVNRGKGAAIKTGLKWFLEHSFEYLVLLDGDGQHLPEEISRFLQTARPEPLLVGNRMSDLRSMPWLRRMTNRFMSWQISRACGQSIPDTQCGFRLVRRDLVPELFCPSDGYDYETEMLLIAARNGHPVGAVPVTTIYGDEQSKIRRVRDTIRFFRLMRRYR